MRADYECGYIEGVKLILGLSTTLTTRSLVAARHLDQKCHYRTRHGVATLINPIPDVRHFIWKQNRGGWCEFYGDHECGIIDAILDLLPKEEADDSEVQVLRFCTSRRQGEALQPDPHCAP